jgi:hypothetical protein
MLDDDSRTLAEWEMSSVESTIICLLLSYDPHHPLHLQRLLLGKRQGKHVNTYTSSSCDSRLFGIDQVVILPLAAIRYLARLTPDAVTVPHP